MKDLEDKLLTRAEAQQVLRVSTCTMFNLIRRQEIPAMKIGKSYRIRQSVLEHYISQQQQNQKGD